MNRKVFLKTAALGTAVLSLFPHILQAKTPTASTFQLDLPPVNGHIRHGLLNHQTAGWSHPAVPGMSGLRRDRFFQNGMAAGANDLHLVTVERKGRPVSVALKGNKVSVSDGLREEIRVFSESGIWEIAVGSGIIFLPPGKSIDLGSVKGSMHLIVVRGTAICNQVLASDKALTVLNSDKGIWKAGKEGFVAYFG